jgi:hypothetical protein
MEGHFGEGTYDPSPARRKIDQFFDDAEQAEILYELFIPWAKRLALFHQMMWFLQVTSKLDWTLVPCLEGTRGYMSNSERRSSSLAERSRSKASSKREETVLRKLLLLLLLSDKTVLASVSGGFSLLVVPSFLTGLGMTKNDAVGLSLAFCSAGSGCAGCRNLRDYKDAIEISP